ncbi:MAG: hypothetical protein JRH20_18010 [Deltaproteobacteria bacterium]|nr:hypothetical protein [Deltaproteobacteria bacterium]
MLYLESFAHRVQFAEVVSRWVVNQPLPNDVQTLKEIINFNSYIARIWADDLATTLLRDVYGDTPRSLLCKTKGELKDFVTSSEPRYRNERIEQIFRNYKEFPEDYYRDTPYDGRAYYLEGKNGQAPTYVGSTRLKRFRRIAEKGSRRIVDYLVERIRANADALAEERARRLGIPKDQLITPKEEQVAEFAHAERRLLRMIRQGSIQAEFPILSIPDAVGIKIITEADQYERLIDSLHRSPTCNLLEVEQHSGRYNAINLRVAYTIPRDLLRKRPPNAAAMKVLAYRGIDPATVHERYNHFLDTAEDHVLLEIIVSSYQEFLESEVGRSMHEDRIFDQRSSDEYKAHLAVNVLYLMDYILSLCLSPQGGEVDDVPIKIWVKYMPDTMDRLFRRLFRLPVDASFDDAFNGDAPEPGMPPALLRALVK